jgi:hypothetical protein
MQNLTDRDEIKKNTYIPIPEYAPVTTYTLLLQSSPSFAASFAVRNNPYKGDAQLVNDVVVVIWLDIVGTGILAFAPDAISTHKLYYLHVYKNAR